MAIADFDVTVRHLESRWQQADKKLLRRLFPLLASGRPVSPASFAETSGRNLDVIEHELVKGYVSRDFFGNIIELFGIMQSPSYHRIQIGDVCLFSCCALVAHMVPFILDRSVTIESVDPISHKLVRLEVSPQGVTAVVPQKTVATLVSTIEQQVLTDVRGAFCSHVCYFPDEETAEEFAGRDERRYIVTLQTFHEAAGKLTGAIWL